MQSTRILKVALRAVVRLSCLSRYPQDFDGIIAGAPAFNYRGLNAAGTWNLQRIFRDNLVGNLAVDAPVMAVLTVWHCSTNFKINAEVRQGRGARRRHR